MRQILERFFIKAALKKYKNTLPTLSGIENPKIIFNVLANAIVWEDEGIDKCHPKLENAVRYALNYRTNLIQHKDFERQKNKKSIEYWTYKQTLKYYPNWIGFDKDRISYNSELSLKIDRIKSVSEWKINKTFN